MNLIDPDGNQARRPPRGGIYRSLSGQIRFRIFAARAHEIRQWTGTPQAYSQTFTPTNTQVSQLTTRRNMIRRQALNQSFRSGQQNDRNGFTSFGRQFQKHSSRGQDSTFASNGATTASQFNARGVEAFRNIVNNATSVQRATNGDIQIRTKSGTGVSVRQTKGGGYKFKGFLSKSRRRAQPKTGTRIRRKDE